MKAPVEEALQGEGGRVREPLLPPPLSLPVESLKAQDRGHRGERSLGEGEDFPVISELSNVDQSCQCVELAPPSFPPSPGPLDSGNHQMRLPALRPK